MLFREFYKRVVFFSESSIKGSYAFQRVLLKGI